MTKLLEIRNAMVKFYGKTDTYINMALKFILSFVLLMIIRNGIGYMTRLNSVPLLIVVALICCLLPTSATLWIAGLITLLHLYSLAVEVAGVALVLFIIIYFVYFRFCPKDSVVAALTPMLFHFQIPFVTPVISGLLRPVYSAVSIVCGSVVYYFIAGVRKNAQILTAVANEETTSTDKLSILLGIITDNKEMYVVLAAMVLTTLVVYLIRRLQVDYAWFIAIAAGVVLQILIIILLSAILEVSIEILPVILGNIFAVLVGFAVQFFVMNLDYARVERVQFEDDEYYYYVKAVPKKIVAAKEKTVKKFGNTGKMPRVSQQPTGNTTVLDRKALAQELDIDEDLLK